MDLIPEKFLEQKRSRLGWLWFLLILTCLVLLVVWVRFQNENFRRLESAVHNLSFSHGLYLGMPFEGKERLIAYLSERGYAFFSDTHPNTLEFKKGDFLLLRVKANERKGVTAIYLYLLESVKVNGFQDVPRGDLLGLTKKEVRSIFGVPRKRMRHLQEIFNKGELPQSSWAYESWFYEARELDLTLTFNFDGIVVEVVLQYPIARGAP